MKKILFISLSFLFLFVHNVFWEGNIIQDALLWQDESNIVQINDSDDWIDVVTNILSWFKSEIFSLVTILTVAVFIYIGIKFATSKWNPEEFKKAWLQFIYAILWVFFIFMAWWLVKLISTLSV